MPDEEKKKMSVEELLATLIVTIGKLNKKLDKQEKQKVLDQDMKYQFLLMIMESRKEEREWDRMLQLAAVISGNDKGGYYWPKKYNK